MEFAGPRGYSCGMSPEDALRNIFGFDELRAEQRPVIDAILKGRNALAVLPTGGGKSLCYQLPAVCRSGVTLVVSPLIALMRDQVRSLNQAGVVAGALTSGNTEEENDRINTELAAGRLKILYLAPERLATTATQFLLRKINVTSIAVDEAHCVSQWGHDFRPDYLRLRDLRTVFPDAQVTAFTATADAETRQEIAARLFDEPPDVFVSGFDRPNLNLSFEIKTEPRKQLLGFLAVRNGQSGIVYCATRNKTEVLANALNAEGHAAVAYHAGMEAEARRAAELRFQQEDGLVVCATVAFGMGIDKPDIRFVFHADMPKSVEAYYQEIGRAGRDGDAADTKTLYGLDDILLRRSQIDEGLADQTRKEMDHKRLNALLGIAGATVCRRIPLLEYFGEKSTACGNCDVCGLPPETMDATEPVRMALSAMVRSGQRFGVGHITDILLGRSTDKVRRWKHDELPTFGVGKAWNSLKWRSFFIQMMGRDLIRPVEGRGLGITDSAHAVLRGEETVIFRVDKNNLKKNLSRSAKPMVSEEDESLLAALKAKRRELAEAAKAPAYIIFGDKTLIEMAQKKPGSLDDLIGIHGIGAKKLERYGQIFLNVINGVNGETHPARRKLAGRSDGALFDRLAEAQLRLARGETGLDVFLSCTKTTLAKIAKEKPASLSELERLPGMGEVKTRRFGPAFLDEINEI